MKRKIGNELISWYVYYSRKSRTTTFDQRKTVCFAMKIPRVVHSL